MTRPALTLYRLAVRALLPGDFRREFGHELEETVAARLASAGGASGRWLALASELLDLLRTAAREWRSALTGGPSRPSGGRRGPEAKVGGGWGDLRTSARSLTRRPGLAMGVTLTIGLGIGATTTIYSVVDGVILRPLPYGDAERLVAVGGLASTGMPDPETGLLDLTPMSSEVYKRFRERARTLDRIAAITASREIVSDADGLEEQITSAQISPELLEMLAVSPVLGRAFLPDEYAISLERVVMLSYEYWQSRYGGDPGVLGQPLESSPTGQGPRQIIVGVLPAGFQPPEAFFPAGEAPQIYGPLPLADGGPGRIAIFSVRALGRLSPGSTLETARAEAGQLFREIETEVANLPVGPGGGRRGIGVNELHAQTVGTTGRTLWIFLGAAGLLLALTAMNAATLVLARALDRRQEIGVRVALGAGRARVVRLLLTEAGLLSLAGGALGVAVAYAGVAWFLRFAPETIPRLATVAVDGRVLAAAALMTFGTAIVAGLLPALRLTSRAPWERLQSGGRAASEPASRLRVALVGGQLALAVVLLSGAGLLFGSFLRLRATDPGFEADGLIVMAPASREMRIRIGPGQPSPRDVQIQAVWDPALAALRPVPGVESVAAANVLPFQAPAWAPRLLLADDGPEVVREGIAGYAVTPGYFDTMKTEVIAGRAFESSDGSDAEPVALVNEAFVRTQLGGRDALGTLVRRAAEGPGRSGAEVAMRIVGVIEDVVQARPEDGARPAIYIPYGQADLPQLASMWSVARTGLPPASVVPELRRAVADAGSLAQNVATMEGRMAESRATPRFQTVLLGAFAAVAMLLAAAGLHGSLSHAVRRRQRELGVRIALGADRGSVMRMVLAQGLRVSVVGLAIGIAGTLGLSRLLAAFLYDMEPYDPVTLLGVTVVLILVSAIACVAPARRATSIDPVRVLSAE
jgi:putative ABC transport system permease protein